MRRGHFTVKFEFKSAGAGGKILRNFVSKALQLQEGPPAAPSVSAASPLDWRSSSAGSNLDCLLYSLLPRCSAQVMPNLGKPYWGLQEKESGAENSLLLVHPACGVRGQ